MRTSYFLLSLLFMSALLINCSSPQIDYPEGAVTDFNGLIEQFKQPSKEYGTSPFYVWNSIITKEGIDRDMKAFKDAGFGGVFVHPRPGLITEYLSENWFDLFRHTVDKGKELDMDVWIYDENSYPSGFAGGHVPAEMPESYNQGQGLNPMQVDAIPEDFEDYYLILKKEDGAYVDVTASTQNEKGKQGEYILFTKTFYGKSSWFGGFSYVDLLVEGVTEKFLEITMTGYEKVAGEEFGKTVPGLFTDEPEINTPGGIRWTPDLFTVFNEQWGYDLKLHLPSLFMEVGDWKKVRHNYTKTLLWLFIERWSKPSCNYCEEKGLKYTGHYWEHGWPGMRLGGDNMAMYAYHQVPGIDMLFNQFNEESPGAQFGNIRSVKELASVANQMGRQRTLSETYGGGGWELTFEDMKRLGDWEYVLGVNLMNQHLSHYTLAGARKYDYPPSFNTHAPWWDNYKELNEYYKRLSLALSSGKQKNDILVIEPTTTAWLYDSYVGGGRNETFNTVGQSFQSFVTKLEKSQVEYDLGSEDIINNHGRIEGGNFVVGKCSYSKVVIPPHMENLNASTFGLLKKFVLNGGELIAFAVPNLLDGIESEEVSSLFNGVRVFNELDKEVIANKFGSQSISFQNISGGNLFHHRRLMEDGQVLFLANSSLEEVCSGSLTLNGKDAVLLDAFTGEVVDYKEQIEGSEIRLQFALPAAGSLLLFISESTFKGFPAPEEFHVFTEVAATTDIEVERKRENALTIDFCDIKVSGEVVNDLHVYNACAKVYQAHGFKHGNPWNHSIQYKKNILEWGDFDKNSGYEAVYKFTVEDKFDFSTITVVVEKPQLWSVFINGQQVEVEPDKKWLDDTFGVYSVGKWIKKGENKIEIKCYPMHILAEVEPIYLVGDFTLESAEKGWKIKAPAGDMKMGSWKEQGYPFYSWGVSYKKEFEIKDLSKHYSVELGDWKGTVADLKVNERKAGAIMLHSDKYDVSQYLVEGTNTVELEIIGSLKNLLGPHHNNPAPGLASPWHWRNVKAYPSGENYQQLDYGLMDDFNLVHAK